MGKLLAQSCVLVGVLTMQGCLLDRSGTNAPECGADSECSDGACVAGRCVANGVDAGIDSGPPPEEDSGVDAGSDAGADGGPRDSGPGDSGPLDAGPPDGGPPDAGPPPAHCSDALLNMGETDVDCGGECAPCSLCQSCSTGDDCAGGSCRGGLCRAELTEVPTDRLGRRVVYQRDDGAILLAHYEPGAAYAAYDPGEAQVVSATAGTSASSTWAPDPCVESGHLPFTAFNAAGRRVTMECGTHRGDIRAVATSTSVFTSFEEGAYGYPSTGDPGWGAIARVGGMGRSFHAICGSRVSSTIGGVGYCDGTGSSAEPFARHLVSFSTDSGGANYVGCGTSGCQGPSCPLAVWVWLEP